MLQILLIEDNRGDVILVQHALEEHHLVYELQVVSDGEEALRFIQRMGSAGEPACPDLLLLDLNLPKIGGPEILGEFRKHPACVRTPVIVVSSSDAPRDRMKMDALGVSHYFRKPTEFDAFLGLGVIVKQVVASERE